MRNFSKKSNIIFITSLFGEEFELGIQKVNLPGFSFSHSTQTKGKNPFIAQSGIIDWSELKLSVLIDEKLEVWKGLFQASLPYVNLETMVSSAQGNKNSKLIIKDSKGFEEVLVINFEDCYLSSVGDVDYSYNDEDEVISCEVSIKFNKASLGK